MQRQMSGSSDSSTWSKIYESDTSEEPVYRNATPKIEPPSLFTSKQNSLDSVQYELDESEEFYTSLAEAVRVHPCLYDPMDKAYRTNEKYRNECWTQVATRINYRGDIVPLSKQWISLRETYREWRPNDPANMGEFPILFASLNWLDQFVIPLYERNPLFAAMIKVHNHAAKQKELAEKRAESWKVAAKIKTRKGPAPKVVKEKDVYDISLDSIDIEEEEDKHEERDKPTPKVRDNKKMMSKYSTPRRVTRFYQPVIEDEETE